MSLRGTDMAIFRRLPFFRLHVGRDWERREGYRLTLLLAPWPIEEQVQGELTRAFINLSVCLTWNGVAWRCYAPDPALRSVRNAR